MSTWLESKLGNTGQVITGKTPSRDNPDDWGNEVLFVTPSDYKDYGKKASSSSRMLSKVGATRQGKRLLPKNSVLVTCIGSDMGKVVMNDRPCVTNQQINAIIPDSAIASADYLYYLAKDLYETLKTLGGDGTAVPILNKSDFEDIDVLLPPPPEQSVIATVLSNLDDKIDLLHRQNKTLEAMAETLFRQWFVEEPKEGWQEKPLSGVANFRNGLACQKFPPESDLEKLPVLKIRELSSGISDASDWATSKVDSVYIVEAGDVIFSWSASLMVKVWDGERCVLNQHLFKVTSDEFPKWFYLMWCKHHLAEFIAISASHATTMGHIKRGDLDAAMVLIPSPDELTAMSTQMTSLLDKQIANAKQIRSLEKLRDMLLPKLMSGEVRVAC